jgi:hypothetical protein
MLKRLLRRWLGIDQNSEDINGLNNLYRNLASIGVDVHFKEPHMILVYSRLNGGQLRHISAEFASLQDLNAFVKRLESEFRTTRTTWDLPRGMDRRLFMDEAPQ